MATTIPVGALAMFGGGIEGLRINQLRQQGWLLCDGAPYAAGDEYQALFNRIGMNYGGDNDAKTFNVPDFRGRFARGTDHGRGKDPDAASRTAASAGGSTGDHVGSAQAYATGLPANQFRTAEAGAHQHVAPHLSSDYHNTPLSAWGNTVMEWPGSDKNTSEAGDHPHTVSGGDSESRPGNVYSFFLIKFVNVEAVDAAEVAAVAGVAAPAAGGPSAVPIGTVLMFGGDASDQATADKLRAEGWLPCFGQQLAVAEYRSLFNVVQFFFGGQGETFLLPDIRGQFIRGARTATDTGPSGTIGTAQNYNTMLPLHPIETKDGSLLEVAGVGGHNHSLENLPKDRHESYYTAGHQTAEFGADSTQVDSAGVHWHAIVSGGDKETRSINIYVDYIIKFAEPAQ
jgi:microcystin-dependent protein